MSLKKRVLTPREMILVKKRGSVTKYQRILGVHVNIHVNKKGREYIMTRKAGGGVRRLYLD